MATSTFTAAGELPGPARTSSWLDFLLNLISSSSSDPASVDDVLTLISQSGLLARIPADETQHKLMVRINSLISSQNALGYRLAHLWIQQDPAVWNDHLVANAATWATQIVNLLSAPEKLLTQRDRSDVLLPAVLQFASTHLLPEGVAARQEFYRQVVHPNLPKIVVGLSQLFEAIVVKQEAEGYGVFASHLHAVLVFVNRLLHAHSAQFRPVSSRIHEAVTVLLYRDDAQLIPNSIFKAAAAVLSSLHLTGALAAKGSDASGGTARTTQSQLWAATLQSQIDLAVEAWRHATSAYEAYDANHLSGEVVTSSHKGFQPYPKDPLAATHIAHSRLTLLLGKKGRTGLINLHLSAATARPVPIPVGKLITLALDMLHTDLNSRFKPTAEAKTASLQASHLPTLHIRALALIARLALTNPAAIPLEAARILGDICTVAEASAASGGRVKLAAFRTLAVLVGRESVALPLDPDGRTTLRLARLAAAQIARTVLQPATTFSTSANADGRKAKKAKLYESDSMFGSSISPKDRIALLSPEEIGCTLSALEIAISVYPHLTTSLSPVHFDCSQLALQTTLSLVETLSDSIYTHSTVLRSDSFGRGAPTAVDLLVKAMEAVAEMCMDATSATLAVVVPRVVPVLARVARSPSGAGGVQVKSAAERALSMVQASRKGKFVPIAKGVGFGPRAAEDIEAAPEGAKLGEMSRAIPVTSENDTECLTSASTAILGGGALAHKADDPAHAENGDGREGQAERTMDVEAIAAESDELFSAGIPSASAITAPGAVGMGRPSSPLLRSPTEKRIFSPDPVKPSHRPATPRIGSPASSHARALSRHSSPTLDIATAASPANATRVRPAKTPLEQAEIEPVVQIQSVTVDDQVHQGGLNDDDDDDDGDEAMPEIDLGESEDDDEDQA